MNARTLNFRTLVAVALTVALAIAGLTVGPVDAQSGDSTETVVVDGADRYATAARVALEFGNAGFAPTLWIANGETMVDALPAGVASPEGDKILLVRRDDVPLATAVALSQIERGRTVFLGGDGVISPEVRQRVESLTPNCPHDEACK